MSNVQDLLRSDAAEPTDIVRRPVEPDDIHGLDVDPRALPVHRAMLASFIAIVLMPALVVFLYQALWMTPQYQSDAQFVMRGDTAHTNQIATIAGISSSIGVMNRTQEGSILTRYYPSRTFVEAIRPDMDLAAIYSADSVDTFSRLQSNADSSTVAAHWGKFVDVSMDPLSGIVSLSVRTFDPQTAQALCALALKNGEAMLNHLLDSSRQDALRIAGQERQRAAEDLDAVRKQMEAFRQNAGVLNPSDAGSQALDVIFDRRTERAQLAAELQAALTTLSPSAPQIKSMRARLAALDRQIEALTQALTKDKKGANLAALISDYDSLDLKREFAEDAYSRSELTLLRTTAEVDGWHVYLVPLAAPSLPTESAEPTPLKSTGYILLIALGIWLSLTLLGAGVMDHRQ